MTEYTIEQLKAMAYDELVKLESAQANLKALNQAIQAKLVKEEPVEKTNKQGTTKLK
jgi:hypothetical protein